MDSRCTATFKFACMGADEAHLCIDPIPQRCRDMEWLRLVKLVDDHCCGRFIFKLETCRKSSTDFFFGHLTRHRQAGGHDVTEQNIRPISIEHYVPSLGHIGTIDNDERAIGVRFHADPYDHSKRISDLPNPGKQPAYSISACVEYRDCRPETQTFPPFHMTFAFRKNGGRTSGPTPRMPAQGCGRAKDPD